MSGIGSSLCSCWQRSTGFRLAGLVEAVFGLASEYGVDTKCGAEDEDGAIVGQEGAFVSRRG